MRLTECAILLKVWRLKIISPSLDVVSFFFNALIKKNLLEYSWDSQMVLVVKNLPANAGDIRDAASIPGLGRSPGGGYSNSLQYSCLENPMDRGAWRAPVHSVTKSWT